VLAANQANHHETRFISSPCGNPQLAFILPEGLSLEEVDPVLLLYEIYPFFEPYEYNRPKNSTVSDCRGVILGRIATGDIAL